MIQCNAFLLETERTAFMQTHENKCTSTAGIGTAFFAGIIQDCQKYKCEVVYFFQASVCSLSLTVKWPDREAGPPHRMATFVSHNSVF